MNSRIKKVQNLFEQYHIDALIVSHDINVSYLSLYPASESWLLITPKKSFYITDFRYIHEVKNGLKGITPVLYQGSVFKTIFELLGKNKCKLVGFNEHHWTVARHKILQRECPKSIKLVAANDLVESIREIKESKELKVIRDGLKIHDDALKYIKRYIKPNNTEQDVFDKLEGFTKRRKVGFSFDPIIASGPNSSLPHANVTTRKIRNNEPVLVDMGIDLKGYKTDLTRMFFLGKISNLVKEVNQYVYEAQQKAIEMITDGVNIADVDLKARKHLESKKLAKYFGHSLGHGVGMEIHENPRLYHTIHKPLKAGMVVTVEPAVYLPNQFGVRLEEMVLVKKRGCEVLSGNID